MSNEKYRDLQRFSQAIGISPDKLVKAFKIEKIFHHKILKEHSSLERKKMYSDVYSRVHKIYGKTENNINQTHNPKDVIVRMFKKELENKSVLDVGCGEGFFLASVSEQLSNKKLVGLDISIPKKSFTHESIKFIKTDIIDFRLEEKFDVVIADQVVEHIAPQDLSSFLISVRNALNNNGTFILLMPNEHFGPSDVTRILDCSRSGKIKAQGTHLNEATYTDLLPILREHEFDNFKTIMPFSRLKKWTRKLRLNPNSLKYIENKRLLMWLIYNIKYKGIPIFRFETILLCNRVPKAI